MCLFSMAPDIEPTAEKPAIGFSYLELVLSHAQIIRHPLVAKFS